MRQQDLCNLEIAPLNDNYSVIFNLMQNLQYFCQIWIAELNILVLFLLSYIPDLNLENLHKLAAFAYKKMQFF